MISDINDIKTNAKIDAKLKYAKKFEPREEVIDAFEGENKEEIKTKLDAKKDKKDKKK